MKPDAAGKWKKIAGYALIGAYAAAITHISINAVALYRNPATSFPWYAAIFFTGIYYVAPIVLLLAFYIYCNIRSD